MKSLYLTCMLLGMILSSHAQFDSLNLADYLLTDFKRSQLNVWTHFSSSNFLSSETTFDTLNRQGSFNNFLGSLDVNYQHIRNTRKIQSQQFINTRIRPMSQGRKSEGIQTSISSQLAGLLELNSTNRFYRHNNQFLEVDLNSTWNSERNVSERDSLNQLERNKRFNASIPIYVGAGRIEQVQDARLAVFILQDLYTENRIQRMPSQEEIMEFSALITRLKNRRFFDFRLQKIYELEQLDSFLLDRDIISNPDMRYFSRMNDNWDYSDRPIRQAGSRFSVGIEPAFHLSQDIKQDRNGNTQIITSDQKTEQYAIGTYTRFIHEKPINLYWQKTISAHFGYIHSYSQSFTQSIPAFDYSRSYLTGRLRYMYGFYPNSRTDMTAQLSLFYSQNFNPNSTISRSSISLQPHFSMNINYYISPQFRLNLNANASYTYSSNYEEASPFTVPIFEQKRFGTVWNLRLLYSFF